MRANVGRGRRTALSDHYISHSAGCGDPALQSRTGPLRETRCENCPDGIVPSQARIQSHPLRQEAAGRDHTALPLAAVRCHSAGMITPPLADHLRATLDQIEQSGLYKRERVLTTPQGGRIAVTTGQQVLNFCANNYLGLAAHPEVIAAAHAALARWGYGLSSVRFICGTQEIHLQLEAGISAFLGTEDTLLYSS